MKNERQAKIIQIVGSCIIETQDHLMEKLRESGYDVTQATVSRDMKELGLTKVSAKDNRYRYTAASLPVQENPQIAKKYRNIIREAVIKADYAENIVVIKTYPGMAQAAAAAIDAMNWDNVVGSIAGDDTILMIVRTKEKAPGICTRFNRTIKPD